MYGTEVTGVNESNSYKQDYKEQPQIISWYDQDQFNALAMKVSQKCLSKEPTFMKIINSLVVSFSNNEDPTEATKTVVPLVFDMLEDYCDEKDAAQFEAAMHTFQKCSGIDLEN